MSDTSFEELTPEAQARNAEIAALLASAHELICKRFATDEPGISKIILQCSAGLDLLMCSMKQIAETHGPSVANTALDNLVAIIGMNNGGQSRLAVDATSGDDEKKRRMRQLQKAGRKANRRN
jgi:hypothetical protein